MNPETLLITIDQALVWSKTLEGHRWWDSVYNEIRSLGIRHHTDRDLECKFEWPKHKRLLAEAGEELKKQKNAQLVYAGYRLAAMSKGDFDGGRQEFIRECLEIPYKIRSGTCIATALTIAALVKGYGEACRTVRNGILVNERRETNPLYQLTDVDLNADGVVVLKVGKHRQAVLEII